MPFACEISLYIDFHPGGKRQIMQGAGKDMTELFQKAHPWVSRALQSAFQLRNGCVAWC